MTIREIEVLSKEYARLSKGMVDFRKYAYYAITHHSTSIEGSTLTASQVINLLEYGKPAANKPYEHHLMVTDHFQALQFVIVQAMEKKNLTTHFVKSISARVMKNTGALVNALGGTYDISKGDFRLSSVRAGTRIFPDYKKVPGMVKKLCDETNQQLKTARTFKAKFELAFKVHFDLVSIHPFGDGNGPSSRLLMNYIQSFFGLPLSVVFSQDRIRYINALEQARKEEDIEPFYNFMFGQYAKFLNQEIKALNKE